MVCIGTLLQGRNSHVLEESAEVIVTLILADKDVQFINQLSLNLEKEICALLTCTLYIRKRSSDSY